MLIIPKKDIGFRKKYCEKNFLKGGKKMIKRWFSLLMVLAVTFSLLFIVCERSAQA